MASMGGKGPALVRGGTPSGRCAATSPVQGEATALTKEMGSGKTVPQRRSLWITVKGCQPLKWVKAKPLNIKKTLTNQKIWV